MGAAKKLASAVGFFALEFQNVLLYVLRRLSRRSLPRKVPAGTVLGSLEVGNRVIAYRGIRYALALRFQQPTAYEAPVNGEAINPGQRLLWNTQPFVPLFATNPWLLTVANVLLKMPFRGAVQGSEHAEQQLNVFAPADHLTRSQPLPVMVVIHGGAYFLGAADSLVQDGARLALNIDAIVVCINYRLGILGFPCADGLPVNLGYQDMLAALRWVKANIGALNGDANNITLNGESAGAHAAMLLLANAENEGGLFHRVFAQSAPSSRTVSPLACRAATEEVARALGWKSAADGPFGQFLRDFKNSDKIVLAAARLTSHKMALLHGMPFAPIVDGTIVRHDILDGLAHNKASVAKVPLLTMHCLNEYTLFRDMHLQRFKRDEAAALKWCVSSVAGARGKDEQWEKTMLELYSDKSSPYIRSFGSRHPCATAFLSDAFLSVPSQHGAVVHRRQGGESHLMRFDVKGSDVLRLEAGHFVDVPYVFDNVEQCRILCGPDVNRPAIDELRTILHAFVRGQPLSWPAIEADDKAVKRNVWIIKNSARELPNQGKPSGFEEDPFPAYFHAWEQ